MRHLALALAMLCAASRAHAAAINAFATGTITENRDGRNSLGSPMYRFTTGESLSLSFSFDTDRATGSVLTATRASYELRPASFELTTGGGFSATGANTGGTAEPARVWVTDGPTDVLRFDIGAASGSIGVVFSDPTGTALSSTSLPSLADIVRFSAGRMEFSRERSGGAEGFLATVAPVGVPEPTTVAMWGLLMLMGLGIAWRRERPAA